MKQLSYKMKNSARKVILAILASSLFAVSGQTLAQVCSAPGKDGITPISGNVNSYFPGTTALTAIGATTVGIGSVQPTGGTTLAAGDLAIVMQMQGVDYNNEDNNRYGDGGGDGTVQNNLGDPARGYLGSNVIAGAYEYVRVASVTPTTVTFTTGLVNAYAANAPITSATITQGRRAYQVIRVPQLSSVTINNNAPIRAFAWDAALGVGGVLAVDIAGTLTFANGTPGAPHIDATGRGFRGGGTLTGSNDTLPGLATYRNALANSGGAKGDGIAGTPDTTYNNETNTVATATGTYPQGEQGRGAPGNAGGGGNSHNSAGGGGGNGGRGGNGGNTFSGDGGPAGVPATGIAAPGEYPGVTTGANAGREFGGWGGAAFTQRTATRLVMGGGGGAGAINNATSPSGSGGSGGGILIIRAGVVANAGLIRSDGTPGINPNDNRDPGGGGGAGGSVVVITGNAISASNITVQARGGNGGSVNTGIGGAESEGPGGGGGGGVVASNFTLAGAVVTAGTRGSSASTLAGTPAYLATDGVLGVTLPTTDIPVGSPAVTGAGFNCLPTLSVAKTTSTPARVTTDTTATYSVTVTNATGRGDAVGVAVSDTLPTPFIFTGTTAAVVFSGGATFANGATTPATIATGTGSTTAVPIFGNAGSTGLTSFLIPGGGSVTLTFPVQLNGAAVGVYQNPANTSYQDPTRTAITTIVSPGGTYQGITPTTTVPGSNYASGSSTNEDVTISPLAPGLSKVFNPTHVGLGQTSVLTITLSNPNPSALTLTQNLVDSLPTNVILATPITSATTCGGGTTVTTVQAAGATPASVTLPTGRTIPGGAPGTCTVTVNVTSNTLGLYTNVIPAGTNPGGLAAQLGGVTVTAPSASAPLIVIEPTKRVRILSDTDTSTTPSIGDVIQYELIYALPAGAPNITNFQIFDILPSQVNPVPTGGANVTVTVGAGSTGVENTAYTGVAGASTSSLLNAGAILAANSSITISIDTTINNTVTLGTPFNNTARASGTNLAAVTGNGSGGGIPTDADATPFGVPLSALPQPNDTAISGEPTQVTPVAPNADISVTKSQPSPATVNPGGTITYTVTVRNNGPAIATNVIVTDTLPVGSTFGSASNGGTHLTGVVTWNGTTTPALLSLANGASQVFTVVVTAP